VPGHDRVDAVLGQETGDASVMAAFGVPVVQAVPADLELLPAGDRSADHCGDGNSIRSTPTTSHLPVDRHRDANHHLCASTSSATHDTPAGGKGAPLAQHLIGLTVPWRLGGLRGSEYSTRILNRSIEVGDTAVRTLGLVWLAVAIAFVVVGVMVWRGHPWARRTTIALLLGSALVCTIDLPASVIGLAIDVVLVVLLAVAPDRLIVRADGRADG
jgi:hypothetical protein